MALPKVIFDTNRLHDKETKKFFGFREELMKFSRVAEIVIPEIVIDEIKVRIEQTLKSHKENILQNSFKWILGIKDEDIDSINFDSYINKLLENEEIPYTIIRLKDTSVLEKIKELALQKAPPFEEKTDKGFKDAYIYFTILEYLKEIDDKKIFVCTKDKKLIEALKKHPSIQVVKDYGDFEKQAIIGYQDEYFLDRLSNEIGERVIKEGMLDVWKNIDGNIVLHIKTINGREYVVVVENREILDYSEKDYDIDAFINSPNFASTHNAIYTLEDYKKFFSIEEIEQILRAAIGNTQIAWIAGDPDVKEFVHSLYEPMQDFLPQDLREAVKEVYF